MVPRYNVAGHMLQAENGNYVAAADYDKVVKALKDAMPYILHCGMNATFKGLPHPQQWIIDGANAALGTNYGKEE